jgi:tetratricopeptide (TPR) repeat protein
MWIKVMVKYGIRVILLAAALVLWGCSGGSTKSADLEAGQKPKLSSEQALELFEKANAYLDKGKTSKAIKTFDKLLEGIEPTNELYAEALAKQFSVASEYLAGRKIRVLKLFKIKGYAAGVKIMERVRNRARSGAEKLGAAAEAAQSTEEKERLKSAQANLKRLGVDAGVAVAKSYEQRGKSDVMYYELAHLTWLQIFEDEDRTQRSALSWPTGEIGKDALLGMGRCKLLSYQGPGYDGSVLTGRLLGQAGPYSGARHCYEEFKSRYPQDAARLRIDGILRQIDESLAEKDFVTGQYYDKVGNRQAANLYYRMVAREWPGTPAGKSAAEALMRNLTGTEE